MPISRVWFNAVLCVFAALLLAACSSQPIDGSLDERRFVAIFGRGDRLTGAVAFSRPRLLMQYRRLMVDGATYTDALEFSKQ